ncbi:hypothetical protein D3C78_1122560 [compost metagenome]
MFCEFCGKNGCSFKGYSKKYDSHYCKLDDGWIDKACMDSSCEQCINRPEKYEGDENK